MIKYLSIILININFYFLIKCTLVQTQQTCIETPYQVDFRNDIKICHFNDVENHSIVISFTIGKSFNDTFDFYRFILRSIESLSSSHSTITILTNFTKLIDLTNSLRIINLDTGQYEICIEFRTNLSKFIYQPRDGCITIEIGRFFHGSFKQSSTPLLIALASGIIIFFILGLVVQWIKTKNHENNQHHKSELHLSHILSTKSLKQQRDRLIKNLFHRHIDQAHTSKLRQWARNRAFRHRISTEEHDFERRKLSKSLPLSNNDSQSQPQLPPLEIEHQPRKISFHLSSYEELAM